MFHRRHLWQLVALVLGSLALSAAAAEITVYSGGAARSALDVVATEYQKASGCTVTIEYAPVGTLMRRLSDGGKPDVVVLTVDVMPEAEANRWVNPGTAVALGGIGVGVAVRDGALLPDISTPEALKQTLLAAKSITYIDPAKGTSGKHFAQVLERLGIADAMKDKTRLGEAGYVVEPVARGEVELGIQQITEILPVKGVRLVGPLPAPLQKITVYAAAPTRYAREADAVRDFLAYLGGEQARAVFLGKGFSAP